MNTAELELIVLLKPINLLQNIIVVFSPNKASTMLVPCGLRNFVVQSLHKFKEQLFQDAMCGFL